MSVCLCLYVCVYVLERSEELEAFLRANQQFLRCSFPWRHAQCHAMELESNRHAHAHSQAPPPLPPPPPPPSISMCIGSHSNPLTPNPEQTSLYISRNSIVTLEKLPRPLPLPLLLLPPPPPPLLRSLITHSPPSSSSSSSHSYLDLVTDLKCCCFYLRHLRYHSHVLRRSALPVQNPLPCPARLHLLLPFRHQPLQLPALCLKTSNLLYPGVEVEGGSMKMRARLSQ
jgi:hypothetical protein